ncbi:hypothetical protein C8F01DRAFT_1059179 [Mycena amicta]|nr:hypothetical protein C8F01DRAFT_1059179 [Mycena amicta]
MESRSVVGVRRTLSEGPVGSRSVGRVAIDGIGGGDRLGRAETAVYVVSRNSISSEVALTRKVVLNRCPGSRTWRVEVERR